MTEPLARCLTTVALIGFVWVQACAAKPSAEEGRRLYVANGCVNCHGPEGHGDGPLGRRLTSAPRDFRDAGAFKNGAGAESIAATLAQGLGQGPGRMPKFDHLTEVERESVALFVVSLRDRSSAATPGIAEP